MVARDVAVRSLIQSIYTALKAAQPLTDVAYDALCDRQHQLGLTDLDLVDRIEADLLSIWSELATVESQQGAMGVGRYLSDLTARRLQGLGWADDHGGDARNGRAKGDRSRHAPHPAAHPAATWRARDRANPAGSADAADDWPDNHAPDTAWAEADWNAVGSPPSFSRFNSGIMLFLGVAIAYGGWQLGQPWLADLARSPDAIAPTEAAVTAPPQAPAPAAIPANNDLDIDATVFAQLQRSLATAKNLTWEQLSPTEQATLTQELSASLATVPIAVRRELRATPAPDAKQRLQPPSGCQTAAQALYDQTDLVLYRLFPDLLGYNIAGTGFDQLWYALLAQQMASQC